jgi:para-nitrobenzyl esterase
LSSKIIKPIAAFSFILIAFISSSFQKDQKSLEVIHVEGGTISGTVNSSGDIHIFKGIPFAAPPVGELRWKEPQPVVPWSGIKKCTAFGPSPMQNSPHPFGPWSEEYLIAKEPISEDCLYLNVWTGAHSAKEKRPVVIWIYGGGFVSGGTAVPVYDGEAMAKKGIVFVSANYRVGIFGFFALPQLTKESVHQTSGNYALLDQIAAIKWVKKNIAAFGGDPDNITIAGQSAGSWSVNYLVASPLCKELFQKAIAESGGQFIGPKAPTLKDAEEAGGKFERALNVASLQDLRKIPADELLKKPWLLNTPIIDGYVWPQSIALTFGEGKQNDVALLTGWNQDDGLVFGKMPSVEEYKKQAEKQYGHDAAKFLQLYPGNTDDEVAASTQKLSRDHIFGIQNYSWANEQAEKSKYKVYVYRFARKLPATGEYQKYGAFHTGEVAYAYDNLNFVHRCPWQPVDYSLENIMSSYWANFIRSGNPNAAGLPEWPAYNTTSNLIMLLNENPKAIRLPDKANLDFLIQEDLKKGASE